MGYLTRVLKYETSEPQQSGLKQHEQWAKELPYLVLKIDGTKDISENIAWSVEQFLLR